MVGYRSASHFYHAFIEHAGCTPAMFIAAKRGRARTATRRGADGIPR